MTLNYPNPYFREQSTGAIAKNFSGRVGLDNKDAGEKILGAMQAAMRERKCIPRSEQVVKELERYYRDETGRLRHPHVGAGRKDAPERSHGDCAIAAATAWWAMREDAIVTYAEAADLPPPWGSWAWSRQQHQAAVKKNKSWWDPLPTEGGPGYSQAVFSER